ncbi:MAG: EFR1 family ferrodoxin [bacterium]|nr:EFR1 family ferrodoxin [bacterium]
MIFYFSGTGNSKYAAGQLAKSTNEEMVYMSKKTIEEETTYCIAENERIGFVFPIYWYGVPKIVEQFISKLKLSGYKQQYVYVLVTYGGSCGNTMTQIAGILERQGIRLSAKFGVKMVDNYVLMYDLPSKQEQAETLAKAKLQIADIASKVVEKSGEGTYHKGAIAPFSPLLQKIYKRVDHAKKFYATDDCTRCGLCEKTCPADVITVSENGPNWSGDCTGCLKCLHTCPKQAIQFGKGTKKRGRYTFPAIVE